MSTEETKPPEQPPKEPQPQAAGGSPDGTVPPVGVPIEVFTQRIPVPSPQAGEEIRGALEPHENDAVVFDKATKGWIYVRTRAFIDLKKANEGKGAESGNEAARPENVPGVPDGSGSGAGDGSGVLGKPDQPDPDNPTTV